jgi:hypothetical protein
LTWFVFSTRPLIERRDRLLQWRRQRQDDAQHQDTPTGKTRDAHRMPSY